MPTTQTQIRRDTATNINAATPTAGELAWDTTNERLRVGNGSTAGGIHQASAKDVQNNAFGYATAGGSANALTLTLSPAPASYSAGQEFVFKAASSNSGAATLNVNSLGAKNIYKMSAGVLGAVASGDIISGTVYKVIYDGTQFQLLSAASSGIVRVNEQIFTASGTYTPSSGMVYCIAEALGGGGQGGEGLSTANGAGGGAGGYCKRWLSAADIGASKAVTIGAGGSGGSGTGASGGNTSLATLLTANGGTGGARISAGYGVGGAGGTATNGDLNITGPSGGMALVSGFSGAGANSMYGAGGIGLVSSGAGVAGSGYGSGGSGGYGSNNGGAGAGGIIIITEFCTV